ncbi:pre-ribosomal factor [Schizosaccharomyces osmophilus]|uniref:Pre-ribosomal factor n=1 Tax=Schizosaccharomyces osmophilus TaxID=2545709 RepID=A0AAE9WG17_9SCHI|nr:pre-ribosomal factor [Schizosaccharomyces osmophilus]WBW75525.1 pre-ribosomal factor [Schizosaccharomyces osmophilus]
MDFSNVELLDAKRSIFCLLIENYFTSIYNLLVMNFYHIPQPEVCCSGRTCLSPTSRIDKMAKKQSVRSRNFRRSDPAEDDRIGKVSNAEEKPQSVKEKVAKEIATIALRSGNSGENGINKKKRQTKDVNRNRKEKLEAAMKAQAREERLETKVSKAQKKHEKLKERRKGDDEE